MNIRLFKSACYMNIRLFKSACYMNIRLFKSACYMNIRLFKSACYMTIGTEEVEQKSWEFNKNNVKLVDHTKTLLYKDAKSHIKISRIYDILIMHMKWKYAIIFITLSV